jgi:hypothetical protein
VNLKHRLNGEEKRIDRFGHLVFRKQLDCVRVLVYHLIGRFGYSIDGGVPNNGILPGLRLLLLVCIHLMGFVYTPLSSKYHLESTLKTSDFIRSHPFRG